MNLSTSKNGIQHDRQHDRSRDDLPDSDLASHKLATRDLGLNPGCQKYSGRAVIAAVCRAFDVGRTEMLSEKRTRRLSMSRQAAMAIMAEFTDLSLAHIARIINRDHTTVLHGLKTVRTRIVDDPFYAARVHDAIRLLPTSDDPVFDTGRVAVIVRDGERITGHLVDDQSARDTRSAKIAASGDERDAAHDRAPKSRSKPPLGYCKIQEMIASGSAQYGERMRRTHGEQAKWH